MDKSFQCKKKYVSLRCFWKNLSIIRLISGANIRNMWKTLAISGVFLLVCFVFLAIQVLFSRKKSFPKTHVSQNKALRDKGIHCVQTQDYEERHRKGLYDN